MNIYTSTVNLHCDKDVMNINHNKIIFKVFFLKILVLGNSGEIVLFNFKIPL